MGFKEVQQVRNMWLCRAQHVVHHGASGCSPRKAEGEIPGAEQVRGSEDDEIVVPRFRQATRHQQAQPGA